MVKSIAVNADEKDMEHLPAVQPQKQEPIQAKSCSRIQSALVKSASWKKTIKGSQRHHIALACKPSRESLSRSASASAAVLPAREVASAGVAVAAAAAPPAPASAASALRRTVRRSVIRAIAVCAQFRLSGEEVYNVETDQTVVFGKLRVQGNVASAQVCGVPEHVVLQVHGAEGCTA